MDQRPLRLGDLVDDYCPRERRITNHVVVALVEDEIKQTRCSTCDAEHAYKSAKEPRRRRKDAPSAAYREVLASVAGSQLVAPRAAAPDGETEPEFTPGMPPVTSAGAERPQPPAEMAAAPDDSSAPPAEDRADEGWPAHRQLIRATLPRVEGEQPTPRPIPEFTMHQRQGRGGHGFRHGQGWQAGNGSGRNGFRHGRPGQGGQGQGQGHGRGPGGQGQPGSGQPDGNRGRSRGKNRRGR